MAQTVIVLQDSAVLAVSGQEGANPNLQVTKKKLLSAFGEPYEKWKDALTALKEEMEITEARVVLPTALCATKIIQIPFLKGKQLDEMVQRETAESFKNGFWDYTVLSADKKQGMTVCCGCVEKTVLTQITAMFEKAEIKMTGLTVPMEGYLRFLAGHEKYKEKTAIFLFFEEGAATRILVQNGRYRYSGRNRIFSEPGTVDYGTEIVRNISGILQFQTASKDGEPITDVYYAGCTDSDFEAALDRIYDMQLKPHPMSFRGMVKMPENQEPSDWVSGITPMICGVRGQRDINLLKDLGGKEKSEAGPVWKQFLIPVAALVICVAVFVALTMLHAARLHKIDSLNEWLASESVVEQYNQAQELEEKTTSLSNAIATMQQTTENLETYPEVTTELWETIEAAGGEGISVSLQGYDSETGELNFLATSADVIDIPTYVQKLQGTGVFYEVSYSGYTYENNVYQLSLSCILEGNAVESE